MKVKTRVLIIVTIVLIASQFNIVRATTNNSEQTNINLETLSEIDRKEYMNNIFKAIYNKDNTYILNNTALFTEDCYEKLLEYIENNTIDSTVIGDTVIDTITVSNSSTGDCVIMLNAKVWYDNQGYNKLYLLEFHINAKGIIYGYNIWVY